MAKKPAHPLKAEWLDIAYSPSKWDVGNAWLYELCKRYPTHTDVGEVVAKIWLIGRAYSAAAERGISGKGKGGTYIEKLAQRFVSQNADRHLARLPKRPGKLSKHMDVVIDTHHHIESLFSIKDELGRVSLTSKYLHFHRPDLFPIYDIRASTAITKVTPDSRFVGHKVSSAHANSLYGKFCMRSAWLVDEMTRQPKKHKGQTTLRQLDTMLLQIHRDPPKKKRK